MIRKTALLLVLLQLAACGGGAGGSTPAPSGLSYPTPPSYTVGIAIAALTPTVTGAVTSYAVSPALPTGLSLNVSSGVISGSPTAVSPATTYTVTASNGTGSTMGEVSITVVAAVAAPMVSYPSLAYTFTAGTAANISAVSTGGAVSSWSVTPSLPTGLTLSTTTGAITGTPTAVSLPASYVVTAENSGGTYKVGVTLQVVSEVLLDLGHASNIVNLQLSGTRLLSQDLSFSVDERSEGRCNLWNTATDLLITRMQCSGQQVALAGSSAVIVGPTPSVNGLEVLAAATGALEARITTPYTWWQLASDGSYIVLGSATALSVFSPTGQSLYSAAGNYAAAKVFAAPGQVLIALGPAGASVIQTVTIPGGVSTTSPAFSGTFNEWFSDGSHFQTTVGTSVYTYTSASVKVDLTSLAAVQGLGGEGNYFWASTSSGFAFFAVGASSTPVLLVTAGGSLVVSGTTVALGGPSNGQVTIVDLSGSSPTAQTYTLPTPVAGGFPLVAVESPTDWYIGAANGIIFDGTSIATTPKYFDYGAPLSIAGGGGVAAVATNLGIVVTNVQSNATEVTIPIVSSNVQLSADGTVLAASTTNALNVYSLPAGTLINSFPGGGLFTLAPTGTLIAHFTAMGQVVTAVTGGAALWSESFTTPIVFSPDGTLIAASEGSPNPVNSTQQAALGTNIYKNYTLTAAVPGWAVGWVSNSELLTNTYEYSPQDSPYGLYTAATLYSDTGTKISSPSLPQLLGLVPVSSTQIYSPVFNSIYDSSSGSLVFGTSLFATPSKLGGLDSLSVNTDFVTGAFASPDIVYAWGTQVVAVQPPQ